MANPDPTHLTDAEKAKANRHLMILYGVMILFVVLPFVLYWIFKRKG